MSITAMRAREASRALMSVCPDGTVIVTRWFPGTRFVISTQCAQASEHRERVRAYLRYAGLNRLAEKAGAA